MSDCLTVGLAQCPDLMPAIITTICYYLHFNRLHNNRPKARFMLAPVCVPVMVIVMEVGDDRSERFDGRNHAPFGSVGIRGI